MALRKGKMGNLELLESSLKIMVTSLTQVIEEQEEILLDGFKKILETVKNLSVLNPNVE